MRTTVGTLVFIAAFLLVARAAHACLWDRDTAEEEARRAGRIDLEGEAVEVIDIITGRFARNPPLYYEMRLARVAAELAQSPDVLGLYDDAGVACDRLGRHDEAIAWMERKRAALDRGAHPDAERTEHAYRHLANLGTFHAHRWAKNGASAADRTDLERAESLIAKAIALNPDAHFGREEYQLRAIQWLLNDGRIDGHASPTFVAGELDWNPAEEVGRAKLQGALNGVSGLVSLGAAWQSIDVFMALEMAAYQQRKTSLALMARLRAQELHREGRRSILAGKKGDGDDAPPQATWHLMLEDQPAAEVTKLYRRLRESADEWHAARTAFMMSRLEAGRHPDTDPGFWAGYREVPRPSLEQLPLPVPPGATGVSDRTLVMVFGLGFAVALAGLGWRWRRAVVRGRERREAKQTGQS